MKRKNICVLIFLACLVGISYFTYGYFNNNKTVVKIVSQPMEVAFQSSHGNFLETKLQGWAKINESFLTQEELSHYGSKIENYFEMKDVDTREEVSDQDFSSLKIVGRMTEKVSAEIIFQSLRDTKGKDETYLIINLSDYRGPEFLNSVTEKMKSAFLLFEERPIMNQLLIGFREGKLSKKASHNTINDIISAVGGRIRGKAEEKNYFSITGYVPNIEEKLKVDQNDVNIQVAISYDELEDKTYIYIGSPLIYSDY